MNRQQKQLRKIARSGVSDMDILRAADAGTLRALLAVPPSLHEQAKADNYRTQKKNFFATERSTDQRKAKRLFNSAMSAFRRATHGGATPIKADSRERNRLMRVCRSRLAALAA